MLLLACDLVFLQVSYHRLAVSYMATPHNIESYSMLSHFTQGYSDDDKVQTANCEGNAPPLFESSLCWLHNS